MYENFKELISLAESYKNKIVIFFIANIKNKTKNYSDYSNTSVEAEFFSEENYNKIINELANRGFSVKCFFDEEDFISDCVSKQYYRELRKKIVVINSAQKGTYIGRKSLIPSFCDLCGFWYAGSNPYVCSLARDKFKTSCILENLGIPCAKSYLYSYEYGWLNGKKPLNDMIVIAKLNYEASSIGLTENNCFVYSHEKDSFINELSTQYKQPVIVQEFIDGYEIEFPFIKVDSILNTIPVNISFDESGKMGKDFLTYNLRKIRQYSFGNFRLIDSKTSKNICDCSHTVIRALDIKGLCRVDFRIKNNKKYYITDIATNPGYTKITSVNFAFSSMGFDYGEFLSIFIGAIIKKY
ncbi:MAG: hypothetical protein HFH68_16405 [Lachnospiraceae bacterium]|nr:hypothetical protein [Lachnospiraceae bacterium]MCI9080462.1 hypothetical protein [Lachnospiraceae bacterium]